MSNDHSYNVELSWKNDRLGEVSSKELPTKIEVATPPDFPKGIPGIWSPEHLFVASVSSCLMTTFLAIAENSKLEFESFACSADGIVDRVDRKFQVTEITLRPLLVINSDDKVEKAHRVLEMSEKACLISNSVTSTIHFEPTVKIAEMA